MKKCSTCKFKNTCDCAEDDFYSEESNNCNKYKKQRKGKVNK